MNNAAILPIRLTKEQEACVDTLTDALEEAVKGRIGSLALVVCMDDGIATVLAGKNAAALNLGCDDLKAKIHAAVFGDAPKPAPSSIVRPRGSR